MYEALDTLTAMLSRRDVVFSALLFACGSDGAASPTAAGANDGGTTPTGTDGGTTPPGTIDPGTLPDAKGDPCRGTALTADAFTPAGMCTRLVASGTAVRGIRQLMFASNGDLFAQTGDGTILLLRDANGDGSFSKEEVHAWAKTDGNGNNAHVDEASGYVYAGSSDGVQRFKYDPASLTGGPAEKVVVKQPGGGHSKHTTHVYDGFLYVHSGSSGNQTHEDESPIGEYDTNRSLIRRFDLSKLDVGAPFEWLKGEVVTVGLRNANGFKRNELTRKIYAVVNGLDEVSYKGVNVHEDNPGEQVVEVAKDARYGYPFCFTTQAIDSGGVVAPLTQLVNAGFPGNPHDDAWCATSSMKPTTFVQAHSAPLDLVFFDKQPKGNLPEKYRGGAFIAFHGSWNRSQATGYKVVWQPFDASGAAPTPTTTKQGDKLVTTFPYEVVFGGADDAGKPQDGPWQWNGGGASDGPRPSGVAISPIDGALYIACDDNGSVYRVGVAK